MAEDALVLFLESRGYQLRFRQGEWFECLIAGEGGSYLGRGLDRRAALDAAVACLCPTPLARRLLDEALGQRVAAPAPAPARPLEVSDVLTPPSGIPASVAEPAAPLALVLPRAATPKPSAPGAEAQAIPDPRVAGDPDRSLEALDVLIDRVRDSREELGLCSPERQRLAMLAFISEARSHADAFPEDLRIRDRVGSISRQLTEVGKTFWPGSVTALQLHMQPRDLPRHLLGGTATSWYRAAELAEQSLRAKELEDERRGYDGYGWADERQLYPSPAHPAELLAELCADIERLSGRLATHAAPQDQNLRPDAPTFLRWVRTLRWLRGAGVDPDVWARLAGRLRWWAFRREPALGAAARELEASFAPTTVWAVVMGQDPSQAEPRAANGTTDAIASHYVSGGAIAALNVSGGISNGHGLALAGNGGALPGGPLGRVRTATQGKRSVFVSNRRDPELTDHLKEAFGFASIECRIAEPRRAQALGEAIEEGQFDLVLAATGFQLQSLDHLLVKACKTAGVTYVRVNRGDPLACLRALLRDLDGRI